MKMIRLFILIFFPLSIIAQPSRHVVLISIDGLRPEMYQDSTWPTPNLQDLMKEGTWAQHLKSVFPAYTYPSHTAMLTGALPARSGIYFNQPKGSKGEWNWFTSRIRVPTLWQALKSAGMTTSAVEWPVSVDPGITYNVPEIWSIEHPQDRITESRKYATKGLIEELERNATGKLDSNTMNEQYFSLDENSGRAAAYIFQQYRPNFLALHFACLDGAEHEYGRDGDSVRLALASVDRGIGDMLEAIFRSGMRDSTSVIVVGDHGFSTINTVFRPNMLIRDVAAKFTAAGGSAFLYVAPGVSTDPTSHIINLVRAHLDSIPFDQRKRFRIVERSELDLMGVDSAAILALSATPGLVFSGSTGQTPSGSAGPGTLIQGSSKPGLFSAVKGGHHGYEPNNPEMYTGFIAAGAGIKKGGRINELCVTDLAPLIARLLGISFNCPDGKLVIGILKD